MKTIRKHAPERRWMLFSNGCMHGVRHSRVLVISTKPGKSVERSTISTFTLTRTFGAVLTLLFLAICVILLMACATPHSQKGGGASTRIQKRDHATTAKLEQSENPKEPSSQTVVSEQTTEYVLPAGTEVRLGSDTAELNDTQTSEGGNPVGTGLTSKHSVDRTSHGRWGAVETGSGYSVARLSEAVPVRVATKDHTETTIGGAQKDMLREWAGKAANLHPVMWAGIALMTVVAGALGYFGWWTKAGLAVVVGAGMIVMAQTLPQYGAAILFGGLGIFAVIALLILYSYQKGQLDRNHDGIPDFLQRSNRSTCDASVERQLGAFSGADNKAAGAVS